MISKILFLTALLGGSNVLAQSDPEILVPQPRQLVPEPRQSDPVLVPQPRLTRFWSSYGLSKLGDALSWTSTNYPYAYGQYEEASYIFTAPFGLRLNFYCPSIYVEMDRYGGCSKDSIAISKSGDTDLSDGLYVCDRETSFNITSTAEILAVSFTSGSRYYSANYGFKCYISCVSSSTPAPTTTAALTTAVPLTTVTSTTRAPTTTAAATTKVPVTTARPTTAATLITSTTQQPASTTAASASTCSCGVKNNPARIVNGVKTAKNEIPWRCYLYSENMGPYCGCTVIDNSWIMTAAHCTQPIKESNETLYVVSGDYDYSTNTETRHVVSVVDKIEQNSDYDKVTQLNDISVLHLKTPLVYSNTISPACLPFNKEGNSCETSVPVLASGWGTTSSGGNPSSVLQKVDLNCISNSACQKMYASLIKPGMICTSTPNKDTCQGDSGGSIDYNDPASSKYFAIGVVSWGVGCAEDKHPGVYSDVSKFTNWILQKATGANFCGAPSKTSVTG